MVALYGIKDINVPAAHHDETDPYAHLRNAPFFS